MYDGGKIIIGLIIFIGISIFPFILTMGKAVAKPEPKLDTPEIQKMVEKKCVESKMYMKTEHMVMLNDWRDAVVRDGLRLYKATDGKLYDMSLQNTCMKCHSSKKNFCDQCHNYVAVKPYCWDCHIAPQEGT
ncbi:MAG: sulfate reduction electron transfer complex DsrMKJOP subunit DsrJ [Thermodesulfovibrionales bacterium]|nr:sulfate reduction electron transfer complex DsrMKJOP subunit DsrJ [Thermodesulfovibrionales bacterium]